MRTDPFQLLKRLDPPVRPTSSGRTPSAPLESRGFDELLTLVTRGEAHSDQPVTSVLSGEDKLTEHDLRRLSEAADLAEAAGFGTALVLLDGRSLVMNVAERRVTEDLSHTASATIPLDGAVRIVSEDQSPAGPRDPRASLMPAAIASRHGFDRARDAASAPNPALPTADSTTTRGANDSHAA